MDKQVEARIFYNQRRECVVCGARYTNAESLGKLQCREHWGTIIRGRFSCCGIMAHNPTGPRCTIHDFYRNRHVEMTYRGCISADHNDGDVETGAYRAYSKSNAYVEITRRTATVLQCVESAVKPAEHADYVKVHRYDIDQFNKEFKNRH